MSEYNDTVLTNAGLDLAKRAFKGSTSFTITRIMSTTDTIVTGDIPAMTKLATENQKATILNQNNDSGSSQALGVNAQFDNQNLNTAYNINAVGVYAKENKSGASEVLYAVTTAKTAENMPVFNGSVIFTFQIAIYFVVGRTDNVTITYDPDGYAKIDYVDNALANLNLTDYVKLAQYNTDMAALNNVLGTKVNTADMRKPASDVAGIEEVNAKQDKIAYTPADDSKVVHSTDMRKPASDVVGLDEIKSSVLPNGTDLYTLINTSGQPRSYHVPTYVNAQTMVNKPTTKLSAFKLNTASIGDVTTLNYNSTFLTLKDYSDGSIYEAFLITTGSGAITVARPWYKVADDSKVAHLSGANNFDTVPTVNNNPLLLASSLPSDLARTSQQTNFTDGLQSGGVNVATAADLNNYYHANASDDAALSAAEAATVPGIFWFEEV